mmetsp:Transcript_15843/g.37652  ORF Transcript_15843/g.37652 Transcript_15843/m.37652 type:complete len:235 (+) Transcript_15843:59-763(+)
MPVLKVDTHKPHEASGLYRKKDAQAGKSLRPYRDFSKKGTASLSLVWSSATSGASMLDICCRTALPQRLQAMFTTCTALLRTASSKAPATSCPVSSPCSSSLRIKCEPLGFIARCPACGSSCRSSSSRQLGPPYSTSVCSTRLPEGERVSLGAASTSFMEKSESCVGWKCSSMDSMTSEPFLWRASSAQQEMVSQIIKFSENTGMQSMSCTRISWPEVDLLSSTTELRKAASST